MILLYRRRWGLFYLPVLLAAALAIWASAKWLLPLPPRAVAIAIGVPQGGYAQAGERYRTELERRGLAVELVVSEGVGAQGPLHRLADPAGAVQAGFAHGLLADRGPEAPVLALAVVGRQAVWIFTQHSGITQLAQLRGLRVAAGPLGGPVREVAQLVLAQVGVAAQEVNWVETQGMTAANDLLDGKVDAYITTGSAEAPTVRLLTRSAGVQILGVDRASALTTREPRLSPFVLPQGAIELRGNVPPRDLTLLATNTHLLVQDTLHPALQRVLLDVATEVHSVPSFLQLQAEYPDFQTDFPLSPVARRHAQGSRPWLEMLLPYWWAQFAALMLYAVIPIVGVTLAALLLVPRLFSLRVDAALAHFYGELKFLETEFDKVPSNPIAMRPLLQRLDELEIAAASMDLPDRFADRWYTLREHLGAARERLISLRGR